MKKAAVITEAAVQTQVLHSSGSFTFWIMSPFQNLKTAWTMLPPKEKKNDSDNTKPTQIVRLFPQALNPLTQPMKNPRGLGNLEGAAH